MARQDAEHFREETARVQHVQAVERQQRLLAAQRQRAEQRRVGGFVAHQRAACFRVFAGADKHRNIAAHGRQQRRRVQHFRAECRHLGSFFKGDFINAFRGGHHARIGGVNARHVGPDIHAARFQRLGEQGGGIVAAAAAKRSGASFGFAADKTLGDNQPFRQARRELLRTEFGERRDIRLGAAEAVAGAHHFTHVKPQRVHAALAQDLDKQQGGHQLAVADQLIGKRGGGRKRRGFGKRGDVFQQAINLFADNRRVLQAFQNVVLNFADGVELYIALGRFEPFSQRHQQVGDPGGGGKHHETDVSVVQDDIGAAVHGVEIRHAGAAKFSDH
ncbi:hypothetical protein BN126_539 [Cronobacter sakazakii 680]|nr:hypothetical protein BN126_539 [Cronobacter sakazakii 680]